MSCFEELNKSEIIISENKKIKNIVVRGFIIYIYIFLHVQKKVNTLCY